MPIHLTEDKRRCQSCGGVWPERLHVEFDADWDYPPLDMNGQQRVFDRAIVCETCLHTAGQLVGMVVKGASEQAVEDLRVALEVAEERYLLEHQHNADLRKALASKAPTLATPGKGEQSTTKEPVTA